MTTLSKRNLVPAAILIVGIAIAGCEEPDRRNGYQVMCDDMQGQMMYWGSNIGCRAPDRTITTFYTPIQTFIPGADGYEVWRECERQNCR